VCKLMTGPSLRKCRVQHDRRKFLLEAMRRERPAIHVCAKAIAAA